MNFNKSLSTAIFIASTIYLYFFGIRFSSRNPLTKFSIDSDAGSDWSSTNTSDVQQDDHASSATFPALVQGSKVPFIRQVSMFTRNMLTPELYEGCFASHLKHAERWGYETDVLHRSILGDDVQKIYFSKELHILNVLITELAKPEEERAQWLVWFDFDTLILNPNISWELFLPPTDFSHIHFIASKDWNGLNAGVFFVRINTWTLELFTSVLALPKFRPDIYLGYSADQTAIAWVLGQNGYRDHVLYQPIEWHNRFSDGQGRLQPVEPGDLLVHFADVSRGRERPMRYWLERVEEEPEVFEIPLIKSTYPARVNAFWDQLREVRGSIGTARGFLHTKDETNHTPQIKALEEATGALESAVQEWAFKDRDLDDMMDAISFALAAAGGAHRKELAS